MRIEHIAPVITLQGREAAVCVCVCVCMCASRRSEEEAASSW